MRRLNFFIVAIVICMRVNAQKLKETEVPLKVKEAFTKKFPGIKVEKWEKENINYEAVFDLKKVETSATFDEKGNWLETESELKATDLPKAALNYLNKNMQGKKIKEVTKIISSNGNQTYEAEVNDIDFVFDNEGNFLSKEDNK